MAYPLFIGSRYLRSRKRSSISAIGIIAIAGIALGVASLSVVMSISSGFQAKFIEKVLGVNGHVLVMKYGLDYTEYREVMDKVSRLPRVRGVAPFVIQEMMIAKGDSSSGVLLKGVDPTLLGDVLDLPKHVTQGSLDGMRVPGSKPAPAPKLETDTEKGEDEAAAVSPASPSNNPLPGIVLGQTLAENIGVKLGDQVHVTTPMIGLDIFGWSPSEDTPRTITFKVIGIFYAGFLEYDTRLAYVDYYQAQRFFNNGDSVHGVEVALTDIYKSKQVLLEIKELLGGAPYHMVDWEGLNAPLFTALMMQKVVLTVILAVIVGVAAFNIIATLVMMVFDKRREISILKSMGATRTGIARIFVHVGTVIGLIGLAIGTVVGLGICLLLNEVGWPLDAEVYLVDHLPVQINILDFVITAAVAFLICQFATILPSLFASRFHPVDGLRQD